MKGGIGNLMKQAQKMQEDMQKAQEEMANIEVTGQPGGGMVSVVMTCRHDVKRISIDDSLMTVDKAMLEALIADPFNHEERKVEKTSSDRMWGMTAGLNWLGGMNLPF